MEAINRERLDQVVEAVKTALRDPALRAVSQRAVQAKIWHHEPIVAAVLVELRNTEEAVRAKVLKEVSQLVYELHDQTVDATLARAGILSDSRVHAGSSLSSTKDSFDLFCLDAKERLYLTLKKYDWLSEFFRFYPLHFYENSFQFVDRIPDKQLKVNVKVIGLGIGGSMAISGLAKAGVSSAVGYEKRNESGPRSVGSRYQNASWRAYDVAEKLLDQEAYEHLIAYRQQFNVQLDDGTSKVVTSDRVQIILGSAIESAQASAKRYGAKLVFGASRDDFYGDGAEEADIVALFTGAHTVKIFDGLEDEMSVYQWDGISSECDMWLRIKPSEHKDFFCARSGEVGAEKWHYTIESARNTLDDITRVQNSLAMQLDAGMKRAKNDEEKLEIETKIEKQSRQLDYVAKFMNTTSSKEGRFDYIFTNAPKNDHNHKKRDEARADGSVVLEGGYTVDVTFAPNCAVKSDKILSSFKAKTVIMGGDACVAPNPQAAYGATLACESAHSVVQLAVAIGHLNAIASDLEQFPDTLKWQGKVEELKGLFVQYFEARSQSENYFQWVQTLICNLYSIPPAS